MNLINLKLTQSLQAGFIDQTLSSYKEYIPQLLVNDKSEGKKVLTTIIQELNNCEEFWFSVAFITTSGVATLIETFKILEKKGVKGKILVSQYLNFTQPEALKRLLQFKNIEIKIAVDNHFHSKGYLFKKKEVYDLIIGSSNLTASALCANIEWNLKITATPLSYIIFNAIKEFTTEYLKGVFVDKAFISNYETLYKKQIDYTRLLKKELGVSKQRNIIPNSMQVEALNNIEQLRFQGKTKALLISATGTGKTYLSAFEVKKVNPKKFLFVVHRLNIAIAAMNAYKVIFGESKSMGVYSGNRKELDADFIFCTIQTISKDEHLNLFNANHFDYIVIDETHRAGADSFQKILSYFTPKFLLGMTATPERTDSFDVFKLFDYNIAYEIRLHRALDENILSPFHYYGVTDITVNGEVLEENSDFSLLTDIERINRIVEAAKFYGSDTGNVRGLIFCSRKEECIALSEGFNNIGLNSVYLIGENSEEERTSAIKRLESDNLEEKLDYIFTVDIFNEGIDIPSVNQIIMLRPTQSAIIFVQQLGRGLRKIEAKEYLTVIDFIGNYKNNFLVPIALYGDTSYNKDSLRKFMTSGSSLIPGTSTINFDRIARERIFNAIDAANMSLKRDLVNDYKLLKFRLGRIPMMIDFVEQGSRDPQLFVKSSKSYFNFVADIEENFKQLLSDEEIKLLELFSIEINNSKRVEESLILNYLIEFGEISISKLRDLINMEFDYTISDETIHSCIINLNFEFIRKERFNALNNGVSIIIGDDLRKASNNNTFRTFLIDNINCSINTFKKSFKKIRYVDGLIRYNKYSRKDVCRILNWPLDISSTVYGYRTNNKITPCFVTYHKADDISNSTNYNDHFIDQNTFAWESRSNRKINSTEIQDIINSKRILLFIKKENGEGTDFYFIGDVGIIDDSIEQNLMPNSNTPVVHFKFKIDHQVEDSIYEYLTNNLNVNVNDTVLVEQYETPINNIENFPFKILPSNDIIQYENCVPLYDIRPAAGYFSDLQINSETEWIELPKPYTHSQDLFVCKISGESMNKVIPNNSWCLFRKDNGGSREGKIVLVQHTSIQDSDYGSGFTIKEYHSKKVITDEHWYHSSIELKPKSFESCFDDIILSYDDLIDLKVIGIFVCVL